MGYISYINETAIWALNGNIKMFAEQIYYFPFCFPPPTSRFGIHVYVYAQVSVVFAHHCVWVHELIHGCRYQKTHRAWLSHSHSLETGSLTEQALWEHQQGPVELLSLPPPPPCNEVIGACAIPHFLCAWLNAFKASVIFHLPFVFHSNVNWFLGIRPFFLI